MPRSFICLLSKLYVVFICMAACAASISAVAADWRYTVRPTDSLWAICSEYTAYTNCWQEIQTYNNITRPRSLSIGEQIKIPVEWLKKAPLAAGIQYVNGDVFVQEKGSQAPLTEETELNIGSKIITLKGSVTLRFTDGSLLTLAEDSELVIDAVSAFKQTRPASIKVSLPRGEASIRVPVRKLKTKFKVTTPSSVAAVRGTRFRVSSNLENNTSRSEVLEGVIGFSGAGETIAVKQGFGSIAEFNTQPSSPVQLLEAPKWVLDCNDPGYVEWSALSKSVEYKLTLLEDDATVDKIIATQRLENSSYTFADLENKCYQLRVNAIDGQGFNGMESQRQFCYNLSYLSVPLFNSGRLKKDGLFLDWQDTEYAAQYIIEVASDKGFTSILHTELAYASELDLNLLNKLGAVYVRVKASAGERIQSEFSEPLYIEQEKNVSWLAGVLAVAVAFALL